MDSIHFVVLLLMSLLPYAAIASSPKTCSLPRPLAVKLLTDAASIKEASTDFGNIIHLPPSAVFAPKSVQDIQALISAYYRCSAPFNMSVKGNGHSNNGQAMAPNGVVVDMEYLRKSKRLSAISMSYDLSYADLGAEVLWRDVMNRTYAKGVLPVAWTDYLGLTVGGTLSNGGIDGGTFHSGPQINNVIELDVIIGNGTMITCSKSKNPTLFYSVLGGLGQFGVITRARIPLQPAKELARRLQVFYTDFEVFKKDLESLVALKGKDALRFVQGQVLLDNGTPNDWSTNSLPSADVPKIVSLQTTYGVVYSIEIVEAYDSSAKLATDKKIERILKRLSYLPNLVFPADESYPKFLDRVNGPQVESSETVSHPWLDMFIPQSRLSDFNQGVVRKILLPRRNAFGPVLTYPMFKSKWDPRMTQPTPEEDVFSVFSLLLTANVSDSQLYAAQIEEILKFCNDNGIKYKSYLHRYTKTQEWMQHFGPKWDILKMMKQKYDPKRIFGGFKIF